MIYWQLVEVSKNIQKYLDIVFTKLEKIGIKLHPDKYELLKDYVEYLGYEIDKDYT